MQRTSLLALIIALSWCGFASAQGDTCATATAATGAVSFSYDPTMATTSSTPVPASCGAGGQIATQYNFDQWVAYTATETQTNFFMSGSGDPVFAVYNSCADALTGNALDCEDRGVSGGFTLTTVVGNVYIVMMASDQSSGPATFAITPVTATTNDECATALAVTTGTHVVPLFLATDSADPNPAPCPSQTATTDVYRSDGWFSWVADNPRAFFTFTGVPNPIHAIYNGCGAASVGTALDCEDAGTPNTIALDVIVGNTYIIRVANDSTTAVNGPGILEIFSSPAPVNDECAGAISLTTGVAETTDFYAATPSADPNPGPCPSNTSTTDVYDGDLWYAWTADNTTARFSLLGFAPATNPVFAIYASCADALAGTAIDCEDALNPNLLILPTTVGNTYLIRVTNDSTTLTGVGQLTVDSFGAAANDECSTAMALGAGDHTVPWSTIGASASAEPIPTGPCPSTTVLPTAFPADIWYSWPSSGGSALITVEGLSGVTDPVVAVYESCADALAGIAVDCEDRGDPSSVFFPSTAGITYLIRFSHETSSAGDGELRITEFAPAANDECATAIAVTTGVPVNVEVGGATNSIEPNPAPCPNQTITTDLYNQDVWYSWTADNPFASFTWQGNAPLTNPVLAVYESCGNALAGIALDCEERGNPSGIAASVTVGITYLVRVANDSSTVIGTDGVLTINSNPPAPNDECVNATNIGSGDVVVNYDLTAGVTSSPEGTPPAALCSQATAIETDVWFEWTALNEAYNFEIVSAINGDDSFALYASCADAIAVNAIACDDGGADADFVAEGLTVGATYIIRCGEDDGVPSPAELTITAIQAPVQNLSCTSAGDNYTLTWDNPANGMAGDTITVTITENGVAQAPVVVNWTGPGGMLAGTLLPANAGLATSVEADLVYNGSFGISAAAECGIAVNPAPGDECVTATPMGAGDMIINYDNSTNTTSPDPVPSTCTSGGQITQGYANDLWISWTASNPITLFTVDAPSEPVFAVYGSCADASTGTALDCEDRGTLGSFAVNTTPGTMYLIRIGQDDDGAVTNGPGVLEIQGFNLPTNDECATPLALGTGDHVIGFATLGATASPEPLPAGPCPSTTVLPTAFPADLWVSWPSTGGILFASVEGFSGITDPVVAIYESCADATAGIAVDCEDRGDPSVISMQSTAGITYLIRFSHETSSPGVGELIINEIPPAVNDECATATSLGMGPVSILADLRGGTQSPEPIPASCPSGGQIAVDYDPDTWYSWTAHTDQVTISFARHTNAFVNDPVFALYRSCLDAANGTVIDCEDGGTGIGTSLNEINVTLTPGDTYIIRIADDLGTGGLGSLTITGNQPSVTNLSCENTPFLSNDYTISWDNPMGGAVGDVIEINSDEPGVTNPLFSIPWPGDSIPVTSLLLANQGVMGLFVTYDITYISPIGASTTLECSINFNPIAGDECLNAISIGSGALAFGYDLAPFTDSAQGIPPAALCSQATDIQSDIWLEWTATSDRFLFELTSPLNGDDAFALYESCAAADAVDAVACDDGGTDADFEASVIVGNTYLIRVGEDDGTAAPGTLTITEVAPNVVGLTCGPAVLDSTTLSWSNPVSGLAGDTIIVESDEPGVVNPIATLTNPTTSLPYTLLPANQGTSLAVEFTFTYISVLGTSSEEFCTTTFNPIANDLCVNAQVLSGAFPIVAGVDMVGASPSGDATPPCNIATTFNQDAFFEWTATVASVTMEWDTVGGDPVMAVYESCADSAAGIPIANGCVDAGNPVDLALSLNIGTTYIIRVANDAGTATAGTLTIDPECFDITGFTADFDCISQTVTLAWNEGDNYSNLSLTANGVPTTTQPTPLGLGSSNGQVETAPPLNTIVTYELTATCPNTGTSIVVATVDTATPSGADNLIISLELPSQIDSAGAMATALTNAGQTVTTITDQTNACLAQLIADADNIWVLEGTFPDDFDVLAPLGDALFDAVNNGKNVYMEGPDHWNFAPILSNYDLVDGVSAAGANPDGDDSLTSIQSLDATTAMVNAGTTFPLPVIYNQDQAGNDFTDQLVLAPTDAGVTSVEVLFRNFPDPGETNYIVGTVALTSSGQATVSSSFEFGGFGNAAQRDSLMGLYLGVFGGGPVPGGFQRGDCNNDGAKNIADPVRLLNFLFPQTPNVLDCDSACDANDDGSNNIADAVAMLNVLFPTGPPIPWLAPDLCGPDPTMDSLTCTGYSHCP